MRQLTILNRTVAKKVAENRPRSGGVNAYGFPEV
jgi:hypothetical protein